MRKLNKWLATLLAVLLVAGCLPLSALAEGEETPAPAVEEQAETPVETPEETSSEEGEPLLTAEVETYAAADNSLDVVYVSAEGNDENGAGTEESPVATLAKAVKVVEENGTIHLLSNIESKALALVNGKSMTIDGGGYTVTRSAEFTATNDQGRGGYNPAMIEVANGAEVRLENITLNDAFITEGEKFLEQVTSTGNKDNASKVQDAIIAAYGDGKGTIILGNGAVLKNFGGMSAVRIGGNTDGNGQWYGSTLIMESGSKIIDDMADAERNGGAAAIWSQGGIIKMQEGSEISGVSGRAIFLEDGARATVYGSITDITANSNMTFDPGKGSTPGGGGTNNGFAGIAAAVTGNSTFTLGENGSISNIVSDAGNASDIAIMIVGSTFETEEGSTVSDIDDIGLVDNNGGRIYISGEVKDYTGKNVLFRLRGAAVTFVLEETGVIKDCTTTDVGIVYLNGGTPTIEISGTIDNVEVGGATWAAIFISANGVREQGTFKVTSTGKITNVTKGYAITAQESAKVTIDGEISNCSGYALEYKTYKTSSVEIGENAKIYNTNGITITKGQTANDTNQHVAFKSGAEIRDDVKASAFSVTLDEDYDAVKLGNASGDAVTAIEDALKAEHPDWTAPGSNAAWIQTSEASVHFVATRPYSAKKTALFAALLPLNEDGNPEEAELILQEVKNTDPVDVTLTDLTAGQSYALMFVNNNEYTLAPDDITIYTGGGQGDETYDDGGFPKLTIANSVDEIDTLTIDGTWTW